MTANLLTPAVTWPGGDTLADRIDQCASMLFVHGYIPLSQREKIAAKLTKQFEKAAREAGWVKRAPPCDSGSHPKGEAGTAEGEARQSGGASRIAQTTPSDTPGEQSG